MADCVRCGQPTPPEDEAPGAAFCYDCAVDPLRAQEAAVEEAAELGIDTKGLSPDEVIERVHGEMKRLDDAGETDWGEFHGKVRGRAHGRWKKDRDRGRKFR